MALGEMIATREESGAIMGINRLQVTLDRQDLGAQWQCRVHSQALSSPLTANLNVDVHGKSKLQPAPFANSAAKICYVFL